MSKSALPPRGPGRHALPAVDVAVVMPNFGTVPLGPDEPALFTNAMERILDHLTEDEVPGSKAS